MNKLGLKASGLILLLLMIPLFFSSCDISAAQDGWSNLADGAKVTPALAIASGNPSIMQECLDGLISQFDEPGLTNEQRGEIALDMIDLLAVLSRAVVDLAPYLFGEVDPATMTDINEFYQTIDSQFLITISEKRLMTYGLNADPAPTQLLWSLLSLVIRAGLDNGEYNLLSADEKADFQYMVDEANALAAEGTNTTFVPLLNQFRTLLGAPLS